MRPLSPFILWEIDILFPIAGRMPIILRAIVPDIVYPALTQSTREFLLFLPDETCESFLEVCAGSGVAAIQAAGYARQAWATDLAHRSAHFAAFNAALNDTQNVTVSKGISRPGEGTNV